MEEMKWEKLLSKSRPGPGDESQDHREQHIKDYDRVVFSHAFHRLARKTQVHPLAENDHVHNRLTHSIEVSSIGRSLAYLVGDEILSKFSDDIPNSIKGNFLFKISSVVQAASIAHDIGNTPFGHAGEHAIRNWFKNTIELDKSVAPQFKTIRIDSSEQRKLNDLILYEGNAQGFRICSHYDCSHSENGLRLTYATLGTMIKYPWLSDNSQSIKRKKFNVFSDEIEIFDDLSRELGLIYKCSHHGDRFCRHPLSFLVEAADDICYQIIDLMDAIELEIIKFDDINQIIINNKITGVSKKRYDELYERIKDYPIRTKVSRLRSYTMDIFIYVVKKTFMDNYKKIMQGSFDENLIEYRKSQNSKLSSLMNDMKEITKVVFNSRRKIELEIGVYATISILLDTFIPVVNELIEKNNNKDDISFKSERILSLMGEDFDPNIKDHYRGYMRVMDFISGMTDNYATYIAKQIAGDAN